MSTGELDLDAPYGVFPFDYSRFEAWYGRVCETRLEPAQHTFVRLLNEWLTSELSDSDRRRIQVSASRLKGPGRLWTKVQEPRHRERITDLDSVLDVIDDVVGIRITCRNTADLFTLRELVLSLPSSESGNDWLSVQPGSEKSYVDDPEPSGYRAYHVKLRTLLPTSEGWVSVRGELQARTLVQDAWGGLVHEDLYRPGAELPDSARRIARRMADLLATVDDLAQDLRDELDDLARAAVPEPAPAVLPVPAQREPSAGEKSALLAETRRAVQALTKPTRLAEVAQQVQTGFAAGITANWAGFGSFGALVRAAAPTATLITEAPGLVVPAGYAPPEREATATNRDLPGLLRRLRQYDRSVPRWSSARVSDALDVISATLALKVWEALELSPENAGSRELEALIGFGREFAAASSKPIGQLGLTYFMRSLLQTGQLVPDLTRVEIANCLGEALFERAGSLGVVEDVERDRAELAGWFTGR